MRQQLKVLIGAAVFMLATGAAAEPSRWADAADETAQSMIAKERQWAEEACTHKMVVDTLLADDFQGTSPDGSRYSKSDAINEAKSNDTVARDCRLDGAKVHFFGESVAVVYGNERFTTGAQSTDAEKTRCLVWTDTWLERNGVWQIVAAQDMWADCK